MRGRAVTYPSGAASAVRLPWSVGGRVREALATLAIALACSLATAADPAEVGRKPEPYLPRTDPVLEVEAGVRFLESMDDDERIFVRLGSIYSVPEDERSDFVREMRIWWRQLTLNPNRRNLPSPVPGSETLFWFDIRSFGWNQAAWRAVAERDKVFRSPWVPAELAERMRLLIAEKQPKNFHVIGMVDLFGLYRRTYQTVESPDYYDLLFASQRYVKQQGDDVRERLSNASGEWKTVKANFYPRKFVDFPQTDKEWLSALLGNIKEDDYQKAIRELKSRRGAVCRGMEDVRKGGSFVARNNRIAWVAPVLTRIGAVYGETFDVVKTAGKRDLEEHAFTDQDRDRGRVFRDGGELLFSLPAGDGVATLLVNGEGKRVEEVPPRIAIHTRDSRDRAVRNGGMACLACHADAYCWIPLNNVLEKRIPDDITLNFKDKRYGKKDKEAAEDFDAFFLGWQDELTGVRNTVQAYWAQATGTRANNFKDGFTGQDIAEWSLARKHQYDDPLDIIQMCRETGLPEPLLRVAAARLTLIKTVDAALKEDITRVAWDEDIFPEIMTVASSTKEILEGKLKHLPPPKEKKP